MCGGITWRRCLNGYLSGQTKIHRFISSCILALHAVFPFFFIFPQFGCLATPVITIVDGLTWRSGCLVSVISDGLPAAPAGAQIDFCSL